MAWRRVAAVLPQAALEFDRARQQLILMTVGLVRREWSSMGEDLDLSWSRISARVTLLTASAQLGAARDGLAYVPAALAQQRQSVAAEAQVNPRALAGIASDGRSLDQLLYSAVIHARSAKASSLPERLKVGRGWLDMLVQTQVADAARDAAMIAMAVRPGVQWVRIVNPPCCQRCAVLSGRVYRFSQGFDRHPGCNCSMLPQTVANPDATGLTLGPDDVKDLTAKQRTAIAGGADFNKTINDYQRRDRGGYLPPTRIDRVIDRAGQREKALAALARLGIVA